MLRSARVDFVTGRVEMIGKRGKDELDLDRAMPSGTRRAQRDESLDVRALFAPDIGVRILGERQLAIVANELLRVITRMGGDERRVDNWHYRRSIETLMHAFSDADIDATPFIEESFDQLVDEGILSEGYRHLVVAAYHDHLMSQLDHKLQLLAGIVANRSGEGTIDGLMHSLMLAMDSSALPVELRDETTLADTFLVSRGRLRTFLGGSETSHVVRKIIREYLKLYDDKGVAWFLGQTLPLVALFSDADSLHKNGVDVVHAFIPNAHYGWCSYAKLVGQVRSIVDPDWDGPDGDERMTIVGAEICMPSDAFEFHALQKHSTVNFAAPCIRGAMLMAN